MPTYVPSLREETPSTKRIYQKYRIPVKGEKGTISLVQAKYTVPGPNHILKSLWEWIKNEGIKKMI